MAESPRPAAPAEGDPPGHGADLGQPTHRYAQAIDDVAGAVEQRPRVGGPLSIPSYRRLFTGQVVSSTGDWVGLLAVTALALDISKTNGGVAIGIVLSARLLPGFFFGSFASALLDRLDRKKVMVVCDCGRGAVMASLPFVRNIPELFLASLLLELLTLMWTPAKEASVPNLVPAEDLQAANSLSLAAAYGTFIPAALVFAGLSSVSHVLTSHLKTPSFLELNRNSLAVYLDVATFFFSAFIISTLALPRRPAAANVVGADGEALGTLRSTLADAREGWRFIGSSPIVRAVIIGISTGLIGGGMLIPLGADYSDRVLHAGKSGFGLLEFSLGAGVGIGIIGLAVVQKRIQRERTFALAVVGAGVAIIGAASTWTMPLTMLLVGVVGICAGAVYVLGFTMLQTEVDDTLRGRIFGVFYTLVRFCLLMALVLAPLLAGLLDQLSGPHHNRHVSIGAWSFAVPPGVRLTLWLGGGIILVAAGLAWRSLRSVPGFQRTAVARGDAPASDAVS
jgi:dTMP kinase